jgi:hypothetical protein
VTTGIAVAVGVLPLASQASTGGCRSRAPQSRFAGGTPSPDLLSALSVLRRPQNAGDQPPLVSWQSLFAERLDSHHLPEDGALDIQRAYIRRVGSDPEGTSYFVVPARARFAPSIGARCLRRLTPRQRRRQHRLMQEDQARPMELVLALVTPSSTVEPALAGVSVSATELSQGALFITTISLSAKSPTWALGVVPDQVASVAIRFSDGSELSQQPVEDFWLITVPNDPHHSSGVLTLRSSTGQVIGSRSWP